uniref:FAM21/CAPZIP domain-containing protein n=1 Tax=Knipowitschia caucasica TaxID=637954 RepID=A0AAV2JR92_KNICA
MSRSSSGMEASSSSGVSSSSLSPSPLTSPLELPRDPDLGVGFDTPAHITTLESAHKSRVKGSSQRRPQSRAARQHSAQKSAPNLGFEPSAQSLSTPVSAATSSPSALTLPVPTDPTDSSKEPPLSQELSFPDEDDIFSSDHLFGASVASTKSQPSPAANEKSRPSPAANEKSRPSPAANEKSQPSPAANEKSRPSPAANEKSQPSPAANEKSRPSPAANEKSQPSPAANEKSRPSPAANEAVVKAEKSVLPSIFDDNMGDLFQKVKTKPAAKKSKPAGFLEEDDDLFGSSSAPAAKSSFSNTDIFQDAVDPGPKAQRKHKEKKIESSLFHDNVDIFADLSDTFKPKHKVKTKAEAKSIFDDDMDDIFSSSTVTAKPPLQQKKTSARPDPSTDATDIFDDPLNALGGM